MRALLHVLSFVLMLPGLILASAFALFGHAIAGGTLIEFFSRLLFHAAWLVSGFLQRRALAAVLGAGLVARTRFTPQRASASSGASLIVLIALGSAPFAAGRELFLLPGSRPSAPALARVEGMAAAIRRWAPAEHIHRKSLE
jgi:hypothetical protein